MLEVLKYRNHMNEVIDFGKDGIFVDTNDLHDYSWTVTSKNKRIASFDYAVTKKKLPVTIICNTEEGGVAARNKLFEVVEKDVLAMQHGRIILGNYYLKCFITASQKEEYLTTKRMMKLTVTLTTDFPFWVKETTNIFRDASEGDEGAGLDYAHDFPFDFYSGFVSRQLNNSGFVASNFRMIIYGACQNPVVSIAGHEYQVNCDVGENEYLTIDSVTKKIFLTSVHGEVTNKFNARNRESYIFEKIPSGISEVTRNGDYGIDIILLDERSEPKWT